MRRDDAPEPFLVAFPAEEGGGTIMLDPGYFRGLDEVGGFLAELAEQYARAFVQSGRARDMEDALEQIEEFLAIGLQNAADGASGGTGER